MNSLCSLDEPACAVTEIVRVTVKIRIDLSIAALLSLILKASSKRRTIYPSKDTETERAGQE